MGIGSIWKNYSKKQVSQIFACECGPHTVYLEKLLKETVLSGSQTWSLYLKRNYLCYNYIGICSVKLHLK